MIELQVQELVYRYPGGVRALDGVSLRVEPGHRVALIGQNGSGKTTLVRHLNGLLRPTGGRVLLGGRDISAERVGHLAARVGLVFQDPDRQIFAGSVRAEVEFGPRNLGRRGAELRRAAAASLEAVGLAGEERTNPYDLGAARRKLLALASVLAMRTPILVLDEPTTGQDATGIATIQRVVAESHAAGRTVIAVSHDMEFVAATFDRVVVLRAGRVILDGTPGEVFAERSWETLRSSYLEPPPAAVMGARMGLGQTPTDEALIAALAAMQPRQAQ